MTDFVHDFIQVSAQRQPDASALVFQTHRLTYGELAAAVCAARDALLSCGLLRAARVAVYLDKCPDAVTSMFGASAAGLVFVPINPLLKPEQVAYILRDCNCAALITSVDRLLLLGPELRKCGDLKAVFFIGASDVRAMAAVETVASLSTAHRINGLTILGWNAACTAAAGRAGMQPHRVIDTDMAAILYTSGSTGQPKGVVLSHRNLVAGATSVAGYLGNTAHDRILAVLPLSFDYGLSQLTTAFHVGATVVLINYLLPRDIPDIVQAEHITGLAAVPPLWMQIARLAWPADCSLRYLTNSGGAMPQVTLAQLRQALPRATPYLMYGLTEAFRSTYLPPAELDRRPDSIGKAIPNAEILVLRPDGSPCAPGEPGELVHRGALVSIGYWNDPEATAARFRYIRSMDGLPLAERAVWSGDTVRMDDDGYLYFIGRSDEMIKSSGYRISPSEVEEVVYAVDGIAEVAAVGVPHPALGHAVVVVVRMRADSTLDEARLLAACRPRLPAYMMPVRVIVHKTSLPRNPNGKIDRKSLGADLKTIFS